MWGRLPCVHVRSMMRELWFIPGICSLPIPKTTKQVQKWLSNCHHLDMPNIVGCSKPVVLWWPKPWLDWPLIVNSSARCYEHRCYSACTRTMYYNPAQAGTDYQFRCPTKQCQDFPFLNSTLARPIKLVVPDSPAKFFRNRAQTRFHSRTAVSTAGATKSATSTFSIASMWFVSFNDRRKKAYQYSFSISRWWIPSFPPFLSSWWSLAKS